MYIYSRAEWGARTPRPMSPQGVITEAFIHHSSGEDGKNFNTLTKQKAHVRQIQDYHMDNNGWSDIGYAFMVFQWVGLRDLRPEPRVFACRDTHFLPAAQLGHNSNTLPICIVGNGDKETLTPQTIALLAQLIKHYPHISPSSVLGHRDKVSTSCPGSEFYRQIPLIRMRVRH